MLLIDNLSTQMLFIEMKANEWSLYVIENIELKLGLQNDNKLNRISWPIYLQRDPVNE